MSWVDTGAWLQGRAAHISWHSWLQTEALRAWKVWTTLVFCIEDKNRSGRGRTGECFSTSSFSSLNYRMLRPRSFFWNVRCSPSVLFTMSFSRGRCKSRCLSMDNLFLRGWFCSRRPPSTWWRCQKTIVCAKSSSPQMTERRLLNSVRNDFILQGTAKSLLFIAGCNLMKGTALGGCRILNFCWIRFWFRGFRCENRQVFVWSGFYITSLPASCGCRTGPAAQATDHTNIAEETIYFQRTRSYKEVFLLSF